MDFCLCEDGKNFVEQKKCVWSSEFSLFILPFSSLFDASDRAGLIHTCMCKSVVLDLYQKVSRLIRKEMNRKRATDRNLSLICSLRLPFILYPNITSVHNVTSQYYQGLLSGVRAERCITRQVQIRILKLNYSKTTNIYTMGLCVLYYVEYSLYNVKKVGIFNLGWNCTL